MWSSRAAEWRSVPASGATSASWKVKNRAPSLLKNSKATSALRSASVMGSPASSQGRAKVSRPKASAPAKPKLCQKQTAKRRWSSIRFPSTTRSGS